MKSTERKETEGKSLEEREMNKAGFVFLLIFVIGGCSTGIYGSFALTKERIHLRSGIIDENLDTYPRISSLDADKWDGVRRYKVTVSISTDLTTPPCRIKLSGYETYPGTPSWIHLFKEGKSSRTFNDPITVLEIDIDAGNYFGCSIQIYKVSGIPTIVILLSLLIIGVIIVVGYQKVFIQYDLDPKTEQAIRQKKTLICPNCQTVNAQDATNCAKCNLRTDQFELYKEKMRNR